MSFSVIAGAAASSSTLNNVTTTGINTSGANLIVVAVNAVTGVTATLSDSNSNTWMLISSQATGGSPSGTNYLYYCYAPTVGSGHTFTVTTTAGAPAVAAIAVSGASPSPFEQSVQAFTATGSPVNLPNDLTPEMPYELLVTGVGVNVIPATFSINAGYTIEAQSAGTAGKGSPIAIAYLIQTAQANSQPSWSFTGGTGSSRGAAVLATFQSVLPLDWNVRQEYEQDTQGQILGRIH